MGFDFGGMLGGASGGAMTGASLGGGWGALAGGVLGGLSGGLMGKKKKPDPWKIYMKILQKLEPGARRDILTRAAAQKRGAGQSLVSRGLGNTTIQDTMMGGIDRQAGESLANVKSQLMKQTIGSMGQGGMMPPYVQQDLSGLGQSMGQMGGMLAYFMKKKPPTPNQPQQQSFFAQPWQQQPFYQWPAWQG